VTRLYACTGYGKDGGEGPKIKGGPPSGGPGGEGVKETLERAIIVIVILMMISGSVLSLQSDPALKGDGIVVWIFGVALVLILLFG